MRNPRGALPTLALLLTLPLTAWFGGCKKGTTPVEPKSDPGVVLEVQSQVIGSALNEQLNIVRNQVNGAVWNFSPFTPDARQTELSLEAFVANSSHRVRSAGLIGLDGVVAKVVPDTLDSLVGQDWSGVTEVQTVLADDSLSVSPVEFLPDGGRTMRYLRTIMYQNAPDGVLFAGVAVDTLVAWSALYADMDTVNQRAFFMLDEQGRILFDHNADLIGAEITDSTRFDSTVVALGQQMLSIRSIPHSTYVSDNGPGAGASGGERLIGWSILPLVDNHFWVIAVTEPVATAS